MAMLTPTLSNESHERSWAHIHATRDLLPSHDALLARERAANQPPLASDGCRSPQFRTSREAEDIIKVCAGTAEISAGEAFSVKCCISPSLKSELKRPSKLPLDQRYQRRAFLVALDVEMLRRAGSGEGINPQQTARIKHLANPCQCARKVPITDESGDVQIAVQPKIYMDGSASVYLQVVVQSTIDKTYWTPFGMLQTITVLDPRVPTEDRAAASSP